MHFSININLINVWIDSKFREYQLGILEYSGNRSLFLFGYNDYEWDLDLFWIHILYRYKRKGRR